TKGTSVTLSAIPIAGHTFVGWSGGGCNSSSGDCTVTVNSSVTVTARFEAFTLRVVKSGSGQGVVTSTPAGIDCGATCSKAFVKGTLVTLAATPSADHTFAGWSGGGCSGTGSCNVSITSNVTITARFEVFTLRVTKSGSGQGVVTSTPPSIDCGTSCSKAYAGGTLVTLSAMPIAGHTFDGWSGGGCSGTGSCNVSVSKNVTVTARFTVLTLKVTRSGTGRGRVMSSPPGIDCPTNCSEAYTKGTMVALTATPD